MEEHLDSPGKSFAYGLPNTDDSVTMSAAVAASTCFSIVFKFHIGN